MDDTLSLDPEKHSDLIGDWADGGEYDVNLHVKQTAPGEFAVMTVAETETPEESTPAEEPDVPPKPGKNPAVEILIAARHKKM